MAKTNRANNSPAGPSAFKKCLIYGPGKSFMALKQRATSSVIHGPPTLNHSFKAKSNAQSYRCLPAQPHDGIFLAPLLEWFLVIRALEEDHFRMSPREYTSRAPSTSLASTSIGAKPFDPSDNIARTSFNLFALPVTKTICR